MTKSIEILLIEDNAADAELTRVGLSKTKVVNRLHVVTDGEKALDFLHKKNEYADVVTPDLILLDLNLPKIDGHDVLRTVKSDPLLCCIPVVILSSSEDNKDIQDSYSLSANSFVSKPIDAAAFFAAVQAIEHFWVELVKLPESQSNLV